jgi:prophage maintenance system killer protein
MRSPEEVKKVLVSQWLAKAEQDMKAGEAPIAKDQGFKSALGAVCQTFGGEELYSSIEEKAANLLCFVIKNHASSDGNKRIALLCSSRSWPATKRFTAKTAHSGSPTMLWLRSP